MDRGWTLGLATGLAWGLVACGGGKIDEVAWVPGTSPGTGAVTFATELGGNAHIVIVRDKDQSERDSAAAPTADLRVPVLGLATGEAYALTVVVDDGGKVVESDPIEIQVDPPDRGVIPLVQNAWDPSLACEDGGYVLFSYIGADASGVGIVDREGNYVFNLARPSEEQVGRVRPGRDGQSILYNTADTAKIDDIAKVVRVGLDGTLIRETRTLWGHHDFVETPDGRIGWLGYDIRDATVPNDHGLGEVPVAAEVLYEADEGITDADTPDVVWNAWDPADYPPGVYTIPEDSVNDKPNWTDPGCNNPLLAPPIVPAFLPCAFEFAHANSLGYVDAQNAYYANWRWLDTMIKVDRATGGLTWQWGGPFGDLTAGDASTEALEHAHFSDVWDGGILTFDNRNTTKKSRLVEFALDDTAQTFTEAWSWDSDAFENVLGDVRRIPLEGCDNLLVSFSGQGRIVELTRDGDIVWDVSSPTIGAITARVFYVHDLYDLSGVDYVP